MEGFHVRSDPHFTKDRVGGGRGVGLGEKGGTGQWGWISTLVSPVEFPQTLQYLIGTTCKVSDCVAACPYLFGSCPPARQPAPIPPVYLLLQVMHHAAGMGLQGEGWWPCGAVSTWYVITGI